MNSSLSRFALAGVWLAAIAAMASAAAHAALGLAAIWSLPCALVVTVVVMAWPQQQVTRIAGLLGLAWQVALIIAYWPFEAGAGSGIATSLPLPLHAALIAAILGLLALAFLALFVAPALGLLGRLRRMGGALEAEAPTEPAVLAALGGDPTLERAWREYRSYLSPDNGPNAPRTSAAAARNFFNLATVAETRLRVDFFRHLPGIFTGIGIIGTFSGLIMGLRSFRISDDTSVVQASLNGLLQGVWESFLISALAILLAIVVTLTEKMLIAAVARRLERVARTLDTVFDLRSASPVADGSTLRMLLALETMVERMPAAAPARLQAVPMWASAASEEQNQRQVAPGAAEATASQGRSVLHATEAIERLTSKLDEYLIEHAKSSVQAQLQATQALKTLSSRLESVASSIESSGRKTFEVVAARLMDAQLNVSSRHQAMAEQMTDLVSRIETLCSVIQHDRVGSAFGSGFDPSVERDDAPVPASNEMTASTRRRAAPAAPANWFHVADDEPVRGGPGVHFRQPGTFVPQPLRGFGASHNTYGSEGFGAPPQNPYGSERFGS